MAKIVHSFTMLVAMLSSHTTNILMIASTRPCLGKKTGIHINVSPMSAAKIYGFRTLFKTTFQCFPSKNK